MVPRILALGALAAAAASAPLAPARAEFYSFEQMRTMCRGGDEQVAQFRTRAGHALLAESYRARCRMYLLGQADAFLQRERERADRPCQGAAPSEAEVAEAVVEELLSRTTAPAGGIGEVVRDVLRLRFACG